MNKISSQEEAERSLRGLGITVPEPVVRQVADVVSGKVRSSFRRLWYGNKREGVQRLCGKGTVTKIRGLYQAGELEPYLAYLGAKPGVGLECSLKIEAVGAGDSAERGQGKDEQASDVPRQGQHRATTLVQGDTARQGHQAGLRSLLKDWLQFAQAPTLELHLAFLEQHYLSSPGLLEFARQMTNSLDQVQANNPPSDDPYDGATLLTWWLKGRRPEVFLPAPAHVSGSPGFPLLRQHLFDDEVWNLWRDAQDCLESLNFRLSVVTPMLISCCLRILSSEEKNPPTLKETLRHLVSDPEYRSEIAKMLKPGIRLVSARFASKALQQGAWSPILQGYAYACQRFTVEQKDQLQRSSPLSVRTLVAMDEDLVVQAIWETDRNGTRELSAVEVARELLRLWERWESARQAAIYRLENFISGDALPGNC